MKILLIGGTGLISTAITRELLTRGDEVTLYNRGKSDADLGPLAAKAQWIQGDRKDYAAFEAQMTALPRFDCVMDMICYTPEEAQSLSRAFCGRTGHLIFCSTVDVYAKPARRYPIRESEPHAPPDWEYAQHKETCEQLLEQAQARGHFALTILRPAYTYGEGRGMVHSFGGNTAYLDRLRKGKPIVVHGDGSSLWASCHRDDVARAFVVAAGQPHTFGKSYHLTGEEWMTWNRYHADVALALDAPSPTLVHIPSDLLDKTARRAHICAINFQYNNIFDNSAAHADLDFRYTISFDVGVRRIAAWLDAHNKIADSDEDDYDDRVIAAWQKSSEHMAEDLIGLDA